MAASSKQWKTVDVDEDQAGRLAIELSVPRPVAMVLIGRGITDPQAAASFLEPRLSDLSDPFLLPDITPAIERVWSALDKKERISIFGDYDVDGVSGSALLAQVLRRLGGTVSVFIPERERDGYGLTVGATKRCIEEQKPNLIVTTDCGTSSVESVDWAAGAGIDVVITDHHEIPEHAAAAVALVNPKACDDESLQNLAGVGVAFKLCHALIKKGLNDGRKEVKEIDLRDWLDIVALGTVADIVPLTGENRTLALHGLRRMNKTDSRGLAALKEICSMDEKASAYDIGFKLGPRLNAAGRLDTAMPAFELLTTTDDGRAVSLANELDRMNSDRRTVEAQMCEDAQKEIDDYFDEKINFGLVAGREGWHVGTNGIVASRMVSRYRRPTVVIAFDSVGFGRGSCRSIEGLDIHDILGNCSDLLESYGGHKMAAGVTLKKESLQAFRERFNDLCAKELSGKDLRERQQIDAWIQMGEADWSLLEGVEKLSPFGMGNKTPTWGVRNAHIVGTAKKVGKDGAHLKMTIASGGSQLSAIAFGMGDREVPENSLDVLFQLRADSFKGRRSLVMNIKDFKGAENLG